MQSRIEATIIVILLLGLCNIVRGFILVPITPAKKSVSVINQMAKSRRSSGGATKNKKKSNKPKKQNGNKKAPNTKKGSTKTSQSKTINLPGYKSNAPPWQVLSPKEAKKNIERERKRRELAQQGIEMEHDGEESSERTLSGALLSNADQMLVNWKRFNPSTTPAGMKLIGSYLSRSMPPRMGVPEVAFLGRSNVGKSSLLNKLSTGIGGDEARVGKTPGATASVNLYAMLGKSKQKSSESKIILGLTDLPGFGYAKLSREVQEKVQQAAERYLGKRKELALGLLLVDSRRVPSDDDRAVLAALYDLGLPLVVVATKIDKLSAKEVEPAMESIRDRLGLPDGQPLCVSSVTGEGTKELWRIIMEACESKVEEVIDDLKKGQSSIEDDEVASIKLDDQGNMLLPDDDLEEVKYNQGYDWIQDSSVVYDYEADREYSQEEEVESNDIPEERVDLATMKLKDLKKIARRLERQGGV